VAAPSDARDRADQLGYGMRGFATVADDSPRLAAYSQDGCATFARHHGWVIRDRLPSGFISAVDPGSGLFVTSSAVVVRRFSVLVHARIAYTRCRIPRK